MAKHQPDGVPSVVWVLIHRALYGYNTSAHHHSLVQASSALHTSSVPRCGTWHIADARPGRGRPAAGHGVPGAAGPDHGPPAPAASHRCQPSLAPQSPGPSPPATEPPAVLGAAPLQHPAVCPWVQASSRRRRRRQWRRWRGRGCATLCASMSRCPGRGSTAQQRAQPNRRTGRERPGGWTSTTSRSAPRRSWDSSSPSSRCACLHAKLSGRGLKLESPGAGLPSRLRPGRMLAAGVVPNRRVRQGPVAAAVAPAGQGDSVLPHLRVRGPLRGAAVAPAGGGAPAGARAARPHEAGRPRGSARRLHRPPRRQAATLHCATLLQSLRDAISHTT